MVELAIDELRKDIERGTARHIVIGDRNRPIDVFFVGCSFD